MTSVGGAMGDRGPFAEDRKVEPDTWRSNPRAPAAVAAEQKGHHAAVVSARLETLVGGEAEPGKAGQSEDRDPEGATSGNCGGGPIGRFTMRGKPTHDATPQNQTAARKAAAKYSRR